MAYITGFLLGLLACLIATPLAIRAAWRVGYVDHPASRKLHHQSTALLGGAVVFTCAMLAWLAARAVAGTHSGPSFSVPVGFGALIALIIGLIDDRFGMRPSLKMLGQAMAGVALVTGAGIPDLGLPNLLNLMIAVLSVIGLMNAVNFLDNMNGMVGGLTAVMMLAFAWNSAERGATGLAAVQLALAGACVGFLRYNFPKARIFLGDAGSLLLGYSLAASALLAFQAAPRGWGRLGPVLMLAYPTFDIFFVTVNRLREGRKVWEGGKDHTNHRLASVIQCPKRTVLLIWAAGAVLCASGLVVLRLNRPLPALGLSALWLILFLWTGARLSSVPIHPPRPGLPLPRATAATTPTPTPTTSSSVIS